MAKARRKMRRKLMKKMRKGSLSPTEYDRLMDLDREVNQLNRRAGRNVGLGAAAALYMAQRSGALDSLGEWLDERKAVKDGKRADREAQDLINAEVDMKKMQREQLMADLPQDAPEPSNREKKRKMKDAEEAAALGLKMEQPEEDFVDEELEADLAKYKEDRMKDLEQGIENNAALASMFGQYEAPKTFDELTAGANKGVNTRTPGGGYYNRSYTGDEVEGPTAKDAWMNPADFPYDIVRGESTQDFSQGPRATEGRDIFGPSGPVGPPMDLATMIRLGGRGARTAEDMPEFSVEDLFRRSGPRVEDAKGGYTPFLRAMRDRIRRKFR